MSAGVPAVVDPVAGKSLPALVREAANKLARAESSADILDAKATATLAYDTARGAARFARAKQAYDELFYAATVAQAEALMIESRAKVRIAEEYDAAQKRGEVGKSGSRTDLVPNGNEVTPTAADAGLTRKLIHECRRIRDAEEAEPGIVQRIIDQLLASGQEPTRAAVRREIALAADAAPRPARKTRSDEDALWIWAVATEFHKRRLHCRAPRDVAAGMTKAQRADLLDLAPAMAAFLDDLGAGA